nr:MAG: hypothetical protein [Chemarfal virus 127]
MSEFIIKQQQSMISADESSVHGWPVRVEHEEVEIQLGVSPSSGWPITEYKDVDLQYRSSRRIREGVLEDDWCDEKFVVRSESEIERIVSDILCDIEKKSEQKKALLRERRYQEKMLDLSRKRSRCFSDCCGEESVLKLRGRSVKQLEYEMSRATLHEMKMKQRYLKKKRKIDNRIARSIRVAGATLQMDFDYGFSDILSIVLKGVGSNVLTSIKSFGLKHLNSIMMCIFSLASDRTIYEKVMSIVNLLYMFEIDVVSAFGKRLVTYAYSIFPKMVSGISFQSFSLETLQSLLDKVLHSDLVQAIRVVFVGITTYLNFPSSVTASVFAFIGSGAYKMSVLRLVENILKTITKMTSAASLWWNGRNGEGVPLSEILFGATMLDSLREAYSTLELYKDSTYAGLPVDKHMCQFHYMRLSENFIKTAEQYLQQIGRHNPMYTTIQEWVLGVTKWSTHISDGVMALNRIPAFGVALIGNPGVGKSCTTKLLLSRPAIIKGYEFDESQVYTRNSAEEFWEGYKNKQHNVVFFSEVARTNLNIIKMKGDQGLDSLLSSIDSNRYNVPMAFAEKGKVPFMAEYLLLDSNTESLGLAEAYENPAAFARRLLYIEQIVKKEYKCEEGNNVDYDKAKDLENPFDAYEYRVYRKVPVDGKKFTTINMSNGFVGYKEMLEIHDYQFAKHQMSNSRMNSKVLDTVRKIPSIVSIPYGTVEDGDCSGDSSRIQNRFRYPISAEGKTRSNGIVGHVLPTPLKSGKQQVEEFLMSSRDVAVTMASDLRKTIGNVVKLPSLFTDDEFLFKEEPVSDRILKLVYLGVTKSHNPRSILYESRSMRDVRESLVYAISKVDEASGLEQDELDEKDLHPTEALENVFGTNYLRTTIPEKILDYIRNALNQFASKKEAHNGKVLSLGARALINEYLSVGASLVAYLDAEALCFPIFQCDADFYCRPGDLLQDVPCEFNWIRDNACNLWEAMNNHEYYSDAEDWIHQEGEYSPDSYPSVDRSFNPYDPWIFDSDVYSGVQLQSGKSVQDVSFGNHLRALWDFVIRFVMFACIRAVRWLIFLNITRNEWWIIALVSLISPFVRYVSLILFILRLVLWYSIKKYISNWTSAFLRKKIMATKVMIADVWDSAGARMGFWSRTVSACPPHLMAFAGSTMCAVVVAGFAVKAYKKAKNTVEQQLSIGDIEKSTGAGFADVRIKTRSVPEHWNKLTPISHKYPFTQKLEDFSKLICGNMVQVWYNPGESSHVVSQFGFGVKSRYMIVNTHFIDSAIRDNAMVFFSDKLTEKEATGQLCIQTRRDLGNDITIIATTRNFKDVVCHISNGFVSSGSGMIQDNEVAYNFLEEKVSVADIYFTGLYSYFGFSRKGLCGNILIGKVGKSSVILGMHVSGKNDERRTGFSTPIVRSVIERGISDLESQVVFKEASFPEAGILQFSDPTVNRKSPFSHIPIPTVTFYGTVGKAMVKRKSRIEKSIFKPDIPRVEQITSLKNTVKFGAPHMVSFWRGDEYVSPQNNALGNFIQTMFVGNEQVTDRTCAMLKTRLLERIRQERGDLRIKPYTMLEAINGSLVDDYFNRVNMATSVGWPLKGKKSDYLDLQDDGRTAIPKSEITDEISRMVECYNKGERALPIFSVALKDEVLKMSKVDAGITRLFYVNPLSYLILLRMYLGPIVTLIQELEAFYSMVGINMYSEAHRIYSVIHAHPYYMESDFKKFDISAACEIRRKTFEIVTHLLKSLGYNDAAIVVVNGLLTDSLYPMYMLDGDLFSKSSVPSGYYGTAELNCLILLFFLAMLFVEGQMKGEIPVGEDFFDNVSAMLYGDDSGASVSEVARKSVNNIRLAAKAKEFGMTVTASDKDSELTEFVPADKATFLKRTLYWFKGHCYAPLDHESIYKMTSFSLEPLCTKMERDESLIRSAMTEWYLHIWQLTGDVQKGRNMFYELKKIYDERFISEYGRATRTDFSISHISSCVGDKLFPLEMVVSEEDNPCDGITYDSVLDSHFQSGRVITVETLREHASLKICHENPRFRGWTFLGPEQKSSIEYFNMRKQELESLVIELSSIVRSSSFIRFPTINSIRLTARYQSDSDFKQSADEWIEKACLLESLESELRIIESALWRYDEHKSEFQMDTGGQESGAIDEKVVVTHETLTEIGGDIANRAVADDFTGVKMIRADDDLSEFLARPVNVNTTSYGIGTNSSTYLTFDPLSLYLADPAVRAKIRNYAYMRCTTVARISVSGTPFDYGNLIATAIPWPEVSDVWWRQLVGGALNTGSAAAVGTFRNVAVSQMKLAQVINIRENKPLEIEMPWISPLPVARLYNNTSTVIASGSNFTDIVGMWNIYISVLNTIRTVTADPSPVYMQVYVYLKDVEIGVPTGTQLAISTQMSDERETGPVEKISSNLANIAERLTTAPYIGIYARASAFVLRGLSGVASLFGWSAPVIQAVPNRVKNEPYQNGANYIQHDTSQRITWDPKQELPISTEFAAVQEDELVIKDLCSRRSLVAYSSWSASQTPYNTFLHIAIHPRLSFYYKGTLATAKNVMPTPAAMVSQMFSRWHGRAVITFEAVTSAFHRGKLLIVYEPNVMQAALLSANVGLNRQRAHIWDIQETQRYSICVEWNHPRYWADNLSEVDSTNKLISNGVLSPVASWFNAVNGFMMVAPLTTLQSPDNSSVDINVYVHWEDMEFNRPSTANVSYSHRLDFQSSDTRSEKNNTNIDESCISINDPLNNASTRVHFYGEQFFSLRSLFKRFVDDVPLVTSPGAANSYYYHEFRNYPPGFGSPGEPLTVVPHYFSPLNFMRYSFLGMRGSMRRRIQCEVDTQLNFSPVFVVMGSDGDGYNVATGVANGLATMFEGCTIHMLETNAGVEVEVPFYSSDFFIPSGTINPYTTPSNSTAWNFAVPKKINAITRPSGTPTVVRFRSQYATGEDFQLFWFTCAQPFLSA